MPDFTPERRDAVRRALIAHAASDARPARRMPAPGFRRLPRIAAVTAAVLLVAGIGTVSVLTLLNTPGPVATPPTVMPSTSTPTPTPTFTPTPTPTPTRAAPTCENILIEDAWVLENNWIPVPLEPEFPGGLTCRWDESIDFVGDSGYTYTWAPMTLDEWNAFTAERLATGTWQEGLGGWVLEHEASGEYLRSGPPSGPVTDAEGYGWTYHFTGDAVISATLKQEIADVVGPPFSAPGAD